jgi:hypothetical protein
LIDVSKYPDEVKCGKCGSKGRWIDVRPN